MIRTIYDAATFAGLAATLPFLWGYSAVGCVLLVLLVVGLLVVCQHVACVRRRNERRWK